MKKLFHAGRFLPAIPLAAVVLAGCASISSTPTAVGSGSPITIEASNYEFTPNNLQVQAAGTVTLQIHNATGTLHNFSLKNPQGNVIGSTDLPAGQTTAVTVNLPVVGTYKFYCSKPFHSTLGMTGQIVVGGAGAASRGTGY